MDDFCWQHYPDHLDAVAAQWEQALVASGHDAVIVAAGRARMHLFDDLEAPFRPNPHFALWFPHPQCEGAALLFAPPHRPKLHLLTSEDYWHLPPTIPNWAAEHFDLCLFDDGKQLEQALQTELNKRQVAFIGEQAPSQPATPHNPTLLINHLHYRRAWKTDFEVACLSHASTLGVAGHLAARAAYFSSGSEFDILGAYLRASGQTERDLPYPCIIGLDEHAAILHYQHYERHRPAGSKSLLIDAGASHCGYGSDITRTWPSQVNGGFAELIEAMDEQQRGLIDGIKPGLDFVDLHLAMHRRVCTLLKRFELVKCSADAAFEQGFAQTFMPHGLGHLLGLQTHDVGGRQIAPEGGERLPPGGHDALRLTRRVDPGMVVTIEPGLYFIPVLLQALRAEAKAQELNWPKIEAWTAYGGVRIEDNVLVTDQGTRNLTREAFASVEAAC